MKTLYSFPIALLLSIIAVETAAAHVALDYPKGGEQFAPGSTVTITWHTLIEHTQENWDLFFSPDSGATWQTIATDLPVSQLSYDWVVPMIETTGGMIRIVQDNVDADYDARCTYFTIGSATTTARQPESDVPARVELLGTYPNPFAEATTIAFALPDAGHVSLEVYTVQGQKIATLVDQPLAAGTYRVDWQASGLAGGLYLYRLRKGATVVTGQAVLRR